MPASVIDAARDAAAHTRRHLLPVDLNRWLALGLLAFLDQCGRGTGFGGGGVPGAPGPDDGAFAPDLATLLAWFRDNLPLALAVAVLALAVGAGLLVLIMWVNSRGSFAYVDVVASGRAEVARPWREHRAAAASYFPWRLGLAVVTLLGLVGMAAALGVVGLGVVREGARPDAFTVLAAFAMLLSFLVFATAMSLLSVALRDFVVPLQLSTGLGTRGAAGVLAGLVRAHPGVFALYVLLKIVLTLALAGALIVVCCLTCGCGLLPVIGQVLLQPAYFFERAWSLYLLRQMGHDVPRLFAPPPASGSQPAPAAV